MFFVGQLNFEEISGVFPLREKPVPRGGVLLFFYDLDSMPLGHHIEDRYRFRLVWIPRGMAGAPVEPLPGTPVLDVPSRRLVARPGWSLPAEVDQGYRLGHLGDEEFLAYETLARGARPVTPARPAHRPVRRTGTSGVVSASPTTVQLGEKSSATGHVPTLEDPI